MFGYHIERSDQEELVRDQDDGTEAQEPVRTRAHRLIADPLYGVIPVSRWAQALLDLEPFRRLDGVSLSDVPGDILFGDSFPSRLVHSLGAYYLARQARPRDRAVQAAALAHDLGHGPFSHLSEPLMIERLGVDHEQRSAALLRASVMGARGLTARLLSWLDLDEVCALITGEGCDGRGALLNGSLDYDNLDNVARFAFAAGLREPGYDGRALARALRITIMENGTLVTLADEGQFDATAWQEDRALVYHFLQTDAWNSAAHAMLRKAIDLAATDDMINDQFFDLTDNDALRALGSIPVSRPLIERVTEVTPYLVIWEAVVPPTNDRVAGIFASSQTRLALEEQIATESGLRATDVTSMYLVSRVARALPPLTSLASPAMDANQFPEQPERLVRILAPAGLGRDYIRRARMAAERALGALGVTTVGWPELR
jgi:HD superfamily phosphohydrolase